MREGAAYFGWWCECSEDQPELPEAQLRSEIGTVTRLLYELRVELVL